MTWAKYNNYTSSSNLSSMHDCIIKIQFGEDKTFCDVVGSDLVIYAGGFFEINGNYYNISETETLSYTTGKWLAFNESTGFSLVSSIGTFNQAKNGWYQGDGSTRTLKWKTKTDVDSAKRCFIDTKVFFEQNYNLTLDTYKIASGLGPVIDNTTLIVLAGGATTQGDAFKIIKPICGYVKSIKNSGFTVETRIQIRINSLWYYYKTVSGIADLHFHVNFLPGTYRQQIYATSTVGNINIDSSVYVNSVYGSNEFDPRDYNA